MRTRRTLFALLLTGAALATPAHASEARFYFELALERQRIPLAGGTRLEANTLGLRYREVVAPGIGLELRLGRLGVEHRATGETIGIDPYGYFGALGFSSATPERHRLQGGVDLSYGYYDSQDSAGGRTLTLDWTQAEARLWGALRLSQRVRLFGCLFAIDIDGDRTLSGPTPAQQALDNRDTGGSCAGLTLETTDGGVVGMEASGGARRGGRIYFGRYFR